MRAITAVSTICSNLHINDCLQWMFMYFPVLPPPVYVQTHISPRLCVKQDFGYSLHLFFGCQSCLAIR